MSMYYPGYSDAVAHARNGSLEYLLVIIDDLYGRDNLGYGDTVEDVRTEALTQLKREFTDTSSREYEQITFWKKVVNVKV